MAHRLALRAARAAAVIGVLFLAALATTGHAQSSTSSSNIMTQKRLLGCTLQSKTLSDCDYISYGFRAGVWLAPGIIVAVFLFLSCPLYCLSKYCCNCCGGSKQTPNFCCPNKIYPPRYSRGDLLRPRVLAVVIAAVAIGGFAWGYVGAASTVSGLKNFGGAANTIPKVLTDRLVAIDDMLTVTFYHSVNDSTTTQNLFALSPARASGVDIIATMKKALTNQLGTYLSIVDSINTVFFILFLLPVILLVLNLVAAVLNLRRYLPMGIVWSLFLIGAVYWLGHGFFSAASLVMSDVCTEVHAVSLQQLNVVAPLMSCSDSMFTAFRTGFKDIEVQQATETCTEMVTTCYNPAQTVAANIAAGTVMDCTGEDLSCSGNVTYAMLLGMTQRRYKVHANVYNDPTAAANGVVCSTLANRATCSFARCKSDCLLPNGQLSTFGKMSKQVDSHYEATRTVSTGLDSLGAQYSTCDSVMTIIFSPFDDPCATLVIGLTGMRQASGLQGLAVIAGVFVAAWGAKRYISLDLAGKPIDTAEAEQAEGKKSKA